MPGTVRAAADAEADGYARAASAATKCGRSAGGTDPHAATSELKDRPPFVRRRLPLSDADMASVTGVDEDTVAAWVEHRGTPTKTQVLGIGQLISVIERLEVSTKADVIADRLNRSVPMLDGRTPLETIAAGDYDRVAAIAEDFIYPMFT
jgi:DNA-binding transcriptional regulator YiaG